jgi:hypothetical protein
MLIAREFVLYVCSSLRAASSNAQLSCSALIVIASAAIQVRTHRRVDCFTSFAMTAAGPESIAVSGSALPFLTPSSSLRTK